MKKITILLADDHMIVREGFQKLLSLEKDLEVVGEAQTGRQAVELAQKLAPHIVVMDIAMPLLNGLEAARQIREVAPEIKIIMLSAHADDAYVEQAMEAGACGFLYKQSSAQMLSQAIREVQAGKTFFSPGIAKRFAAAPAAGLRGPAKKKLASLSSREREVLQLIAEGKANKETAAELGIGVKTVEKHREHLMQKLNIHDTAGLTRYAISAGIIESSVQFKIV